MASAFRNLLYLIAALAILQPSVSQKWKEMEIAQKKLAEYLNSTASSSQLNELVYELAPNKSSSLECMIFGNEGCQFICDLKCFLYGCVSAGICTNPSEDICECRESYKIGNEYISSSFHRFLPLSNLWEYRFEYNFASIIIPHFIQEDLKTTQAVGSLLQDPRITGTQIKNKLIQMFPEAKWLLKELKPIVRGKIDTFLNPSRHFNYPLFTYFMNEYIKAKYEEVQRMQIRELTLEEYLQDSENIKYIVRQLLLFPSKYMQTVMDALNVMTGVSYEDVANMTNIDSYTSKDPKHQLTPQQIDEIIQAGAFSQLLEVEAIPTIEDDDEDTDTTVKT